MKIVKRNNILFPSIFDDIFTENRLDVPNYENFSTPSVNIKENLANFAIELAAPGLIKDDFKIEIDQNVLKISAEITRDNKDVEQGEDLSKYTHREFNYRSFKRSFTIPETVQVADINATYKNGLLVLTLPKKEAHKEIKRMVEIS